MCGSSSPRSTPRATESILREGNRGRSGHANRYSFIDRPGRFGSRPRAATGATATGGSTPAAASTPPFRTCRMRPGTSSSSSRVSPVPAFLNVRASRCGAARFWASPASSAPDERRCFARCSDSKTEQDLLFSSGVVPVQAPTEATPSTTYVREYTRQHRLPGDFAILINGPGAGDLDSNHRMEIIDL